ncbi:OmpA family protein [Pengzhenrongella frigida]|uniref:OmpA family protein n=1 Tax=Pengzhenrongella frigida TaxID=1259133 RepID=A0A4Q5N1Z2_9MICO|nr:OmpA family protein [Cellulomonas sp. HLT2-17]RYV52212.1 OmpA family protein [Cellulomonas sp. HLT2-17]
MSGRRRIGAATAGAALACTMALVASPAWASGGGEPEDVPVPTTSELAASVRVLSLEPARVFSLDGLVSTIDDTRTDGAETVITLASDILFDTSAFELPPGAGDTLGAIVATVPQGAAVSVVGHTDSVSDDASNQVLSEQRANAVAQAMAVARPDLSLTVSGRGESDLIASESAGGEVDPAGRAKNRRVEIRFAS